MNALTCTGVSGSRYQFNLHPIGTSFLEAAGVYVFCRPSSPLGRWDPIYIGETSNLRDRLTQNLRNHHQWENIRRHGATHVAIMFTFGDLAQREAIETDLRNAYPTPCNQQGLGLLNAFVR